MPPVRQKIRSLTVGQSTHTPPPLLGNSHLFTDVYTADGQARLEDTCMKLLADLTSHMQVLCKVKAASAPQSIEQEMLLGKECLEAASSAATAIDSWEAHEPRAAVPVRPMAPSKRPPLLEGIGVIPQTSCTTDHDSASDRELESQSPPAINSDSETAGGDANVSRCASEGQPTSSSSPKGSSGRQTKSFLNSVFEARPTWKKQPARGYWIPGAARSAILTKAVLRLSQQQTGNHWPVTSITEATEQEADVHAIPLQRGASLLGQFVVSPSSPYRLGWDVLGGFFIFWDLLMIPLRVFDPPSTAFIEVLDWMTLIYWTLNMLATFAFGYVDNGVSVMEPKLIASRYFRCWFWIDLGILLPDWIFTLFLVVGSTTSSSSGATRSSVKLLRILRLARTLRLVRLVKLQWVVKTLDEQLDSEYASILANLAKMITMLLATNHFVACAWYLVADMQRDETTTWLSHHDVLESEWYYQYTLAFHWSITQFTPASMDVGPRNLAERVFAITVVVFALVGFSYLVGSITGSLTQLRSMKEDTAKQFWSLRRYLRQNQVPFDLTVRIQKYLQHAWHKRKVSGHGNLQIIDLLSEQLQSELHSAIYVPHLLVHPLFSYLSNDASVTCNRLATRAISRKPLAQNDQLFITGEVAHFMYFVRSGRLRYVKVHDDGSSENEWVDEKEDWISEPALWTTQWIHLGSLSAWAEIELLVVHPEHFSEVVHQTPNLSDFVVNYAQNYLNWINSLPQERLSDICQGEVQSEMISSFVGQIGEASSAKAPRTKRGSIRTRSAAMQRASTGTTSLVNKFLKVAPA